MPVKVAKHVYLIYELWRHAVGYKGQDVTLTRDQLYVVVAPSSGHAGNMHDAVGCSALSPPVHSFEGTETPVTLWTQIAGVMANGLCAV